MTLSVAIAGASGYAGGELARLLHNHPHFRVVTLAAGAKSGALVESVHPHLTALRGTAFVETSASTLENHDLVFLALPHGASAALARELKSPKIVDLGADFRLESAEQWNRYYGSTPHAGHWIYGLPELCDVSAIAAATRVANPGCYATAIALAAAPALSAGVADGTDITVVAASGTSGAGRSASESLLASEIMGSVSSYKTGGIHQHTPEIEQTLGRFSTSDVRISFTPLLVPMPRGIHATITMRAEGTNRESLKSIYENFYREKHFVSVLAGNEQPRTANVLGTNNVELQVTFDEHVNRLIVTAVIDNLGKGAAAQAIQNANIMCGFDQSTGLKLMGVAP